MYRNHQGWSRIVSNPSRFLQTCQQTNRGAHNRIILMYARAKNSLISFWTGIKSSVKIPGTPAWRWGEWIWLTGSFGLHQNSPQRLNISSIKVIDHIRDTEIPIIPWYIWGEGWLGFPDLWSGQKPWRNWYLTPVVKFGEVLRAKLAKSTFLTSSLVPLESFQTF